MNKLVEHDPVLLQESINLLINNKMGYILMGHLEEVDIQNIFWRKLMTMEN